MANDIEITEGTIIPGDGPPANSITGETPVKERPSANNAKGKGKGKGRGKGKAKADEPEVGPSPMRPSTKRRDDSESKGDSNSAGAQMRYD